LEVRAASTLLLPPDGRGAGSAEVGAVAAREQCALTGQRRQTTITIQESASSFMQPPTLGEWMNE